jgi:uncharacterized oxidoreductase
MFSVLVSPEHLGTKTSFNDEIDAFVAWARTGAQKAMEVLLPGDPERAIKRQRERDGIPIDRRTWDQIMAAADAVGATDVSQ